ncbi:Uncharacterised protein [Mycobacterium tuberculosis]|uniref:Uncharacterized protein n=1 Tax=Mycobacterium tuberculosis TaxID=1773 RepID=A0A655AV11_MYCTX|nr:Uncharacterised protein [Mycobacterium tuberculosis]CKR86053.1 Uncharacterised protein [Mycobacterium tuberculosis]CKU02029.1 Uncharacterised protein [Mycobacterium tuberculosis]CKU68622.1 Uncharacterised protein [Mycobacterium tuberculosis]CKW86507.1 Uncharacterised protein [Mycobacterium tuberculosis]
MSSPPLRSAPSPAPSARPTACRPESRRSPRPARCALRRASRSPWTPGASRGCTARCGCNPRPEQCPACRPDPGRFGRGRPASDARHVLCRPPAALFPEARPRRLSFRATGFRRSDASSPSLRGPLPAPPDWIQQSKSPLHHHYSAPAVDTCRDLGWLPAEFGTRRWDRHRCPSRSAARAPPGTLHRLQSDPPSIRRSHHILRRCVAHGGAARVG